MKKSDKCHPKTDSIKIEFANGETETLRNLTAFSANILFENACKRPIFVTQTTRASDGLYERNERTDWHKVTA